MSLAIIELMLWTGPMTPIRNLTKSFILTMSYLEEKCNHEVDPHFPISVVLVLTRETPTTMKHGHRLSHLFNSTVWYYHSLLAEAFTIMCMTLI